MGKSFAEGVFVDILQNTNAEVLTKPPISTEGIVTSVNDFLTILAEANDIHNKTFAIPDSKQLKFVEDFPKEALSKLNNDTYTTNIDNTTLNDIRVVTYLATEEPGIVGKHTPYSDGVRNIKHRFNCIYDDPEYTGYSILRSIKNIQVNITFKVWGIYFQDIRERSKLLREIIDKNVWYFKQKGLVEIVWVGSIEEETWDAKNVAKFKSEKYQLTITEVKELREKNLEQVIVQMGLGEL